jgi:hypothetical protein
MGRLCKSNWKVLLYQRRGVVSEFFQPLPGRRSRSQSAAEPNAPESCLQAQNFRPPAPNRRSPRRIAKRRTHKAARGNAGGLFTRHSAASER